MQVFVPESVLHLQPRLPCSSQEPLQCWALGARSLCDSGADAWHAPPAPPRDELQCPHRHLVSISAHVVTLHNKQITGSPDSLKTPSEGPGTLLFTPAQERSPHQIQGRSRTNAPSPQSAPRADALGKKTTPPARRLLLTRPHSAPFLLGHAEMSERAGSWRPEADLPHLKEASASKMCRKAAIRWAAEGANGRPGSPASTGRGAGKAGIAP